MKINVKSVSDNRSCPVDVAESTKIVAIKEHVATKLNVPVGMQRLILNGKPLKDDAPISAYPNLAENSDIYLTLVKPEGVNTALLRVLKKYYPQAACEKVIDAFMKDFVAKVNNLSLDDFERLAKEDMLLLNRS